MNWLWPRQLNTDDRIWIRMIRLVHWCIAGFATFGLAVSFVGMIAGGNREPVSYVAVGIMWVALAMLGRGFRYVVARE